MIEYFVIKCVQLLSLSGKMLVNLATYSKIVPAYPEESLDKDSRPVYKSFNRIFKSDVERKPTLFRQHFVKLPPMLQVENLHVVTYYSLRFMFSEAI